MKTLEYYMSLPYRTEIVSDSEEKGFVTYFPDLPGCVSCESTMEQAEKNAYEAKKVWIEAALEENQVIREPFEPDAI